MENNHTSAVEMETFLPRDGSAILDGTNNAKYKVTVMPKDTEAAEPLNQVAPYDPFKERRPKNPTSDCDTLTHLLKASLGSGILAMPVAFMSSGLGLGVLGTVLAAVVCTHCSYILIKCAHELYYRTRVNTMSFADVGEVAFANGPRWAKKFSHTARLIIIIGLFATYFGTLSVYTVIVGTNFQQVIEFYTNTTLDSRIYISVLLPPLILLGWVPDLKWLSPLSMLANGCMAVGLGITIYYLVQGLPPMSERTQFGHPMGLPFFFSVVIFAMEAIGVVMPLENSMRNPRHILGLCGVLNQGMAGVTMIYIIVGFLGYWKYGGATEGSITLNLPVEEIPAQSVKILIGVAVLLTYGLQFVVPFQIVWSAMKEKYTKRSRLIEYIVRTVIVAGSVLLAVAVPTIGPFISLIGALCFSILGIIMPALIEIITFWENGLGPGRWRLWKNILVCVFGAMSLGFGSYVSIGDIIKVYMSD